MEKSSEASNSASAEPSGASSGNGIPRSASGEPEKKILVTGSTGNTLLVNPKQRGNALLKFITGVIWEFDDAIVPDYVMGRTACALFLSLAYHNLKPDYINQRIKQLGKLYDLRVLLVLVDMPDPHFCLKHLTRVCLLTELTLMLAWSPEEAAKILQVYKQYEHKPPDAIMEKKESDARIKLASALTSIRSINKTDASTLLNNYGSLENIIKATPHSLALCPGLGQQKANRLYNALHTPFLKADKKPKSGIAKYFNT
uniref:DNA excision repair protein ERCC-1 n=1 Tax=Lygus hesperus TaxID=30085 RepID=A0A0A9Y731_LYGHE